MQGVIAELRKRKGEPLCVNFPSGDCVVYVPNYNTIAPYCKYCENTLISRVHDEPFNRFGDREIGYCDECSKQYPIRRIDLS